MDKTKLKEQFSEIVKNRVLKDSKHKLIENEYYFDNQFKIEWIKFLKSIGLYDCFKGLEFKNFGRGRYKMCKVSSSSRLCVNEFVNRYNPENREQKFEDTTFKFILDNGKAQEAHFDYRDGKEFFECKCEELFRKHADCLKAHAYTNLLKEMFGLVNIKEKNDKLYPTLNQFGIKEYNNKDIYSLCFDFKQLITHLIALGKREKYKDEMVTLKYIWFYPTNNSKELNEFKDSVLNEFNAIKNSEVINLFLINNKIDLEFEIKDIPNEII